MKRSDVTAEGGGHRQDSGILGAKPREIEARPRNWAQPVILVLLREWNSYGYEMMERMAEFGFEAVNPGTWYRILKHMEKNGAVKSAWDTSEGGPARRVYSITDVGEAYLDFWAKSLEQYQRDVDAFLGLYTGKPRQASGKKDEKLGRGTL
jgi:PadR family transcriptional regulator, regulatory protein PadR